MNSRKLAKSTITEKIRMGEFAPGKRLPTERMMASDIGVSRSTIQSVLRELESEGLLLKSINCRPIVRPSHKTSETADQIAIWIMPEMQDLGGFLMQQGIQSVLAGSGYKLLMGCAPTDSAELALAEVRFLESILASPDIAGAIVWDVFSLENKEIYRALVDKGIELVFIDRAPLYAVPGDVVGTDNLQAARVAVRHLIELGHERIGMVVNDDRASTVRDRVEGYRQALTEAEIPIDETLIVDCPTLTSPVGYEQMLSELLSRPMPPTALFTVNDCIALQLMEAAKSLRVHIPQELSLIGFDWLLRCLPNGGELTTVSQPFEEIGRTAASRLLERISSPTPQTPRKILFEAPLVMKTSTAPPRPDPGRRLRSKGKSYAQKQSIYSY